MTYEINTHNSQTLERDSHRIIDNVPHKLVLNSDLHFSIAQRNLAGYSSEFKFGRSENITSTESVIWDAGGTYTFLTSAEQIDVVSTSGLDTSSGTGARTIILYGLDSNYNEINEVILTNGTTPVRTTQSFLRLFRMIVLTSGTNDSISDSNIGTLTAISADTTTLQAQIEPNNGQTLMSVYTVPAGKTAYVTGISFSAGEGKQCLFKAKFRNGPTSDYAFSVKFTIDLYQNSFFGTLAVPLMIPEMTDVVITGQTGLGLTINAAASFGMILIDN